MLSLGGERLPPTKKKKVLDHCLHHDLGMQRLLWCFLAHLLILEYPDHHQNLISSSLYYPGPFHKISSQSVDNVLSNVVHRQTNKQTDKPTLPKTLEALKERRPPWPRHIITPILPTVKMLSIGGERLPPTKKKVLDHYLHHDQGMLPLLWWGFAHLLILEYPDHHQNLISSSLYYPGPLHKISSQSVHNLLSNVVHRQTDKLTNTTTNITSFAKEVICLFLNVVISISLLTSLLMCKPDQSELY